MTHLEDIRHVLFSLVKEALQGSLKSGPRRHVSSKTEAGVSALWSRPVPGKSLTLLLRTVSAQMGVC